VETSGVSVSHLWPSLGNAALGAGSGKAQTMLNLNWSGNYGHSHYDNASIILYANGAELLSDIGYTHSKYRGWTLHTASHNTVVIDQKAQDLGTDAKPATGRLKFYDDQNPHVKAIDIDASPAYSVAGKYRRRLILVHAAEGRDYVIDRFDVEGGKTHDWFLHGMCEEEGALETSIPLNQAVKTLVPEWGGTNVPKNQYESDIEGKKIHAYSYLKDIKSAPADKQWIATWRYQHSGMRTHHIPQEGTEIFSFRAPSVRLAQEDDNKLDNYMRLGLMQRHSGGKSSFIAVHEPFQNEPWIKSVRAEGDTYFIRYELNGLNIEDRISLKEDEIDAVSGAGWSYKKGAEQSGSVKGIEMLAGKWNLELDHDIPEVSHVRFDFPDGATLYYPAKRISDKGLQLADDPGFTMEKNGKIHFYTFPHKEYNGVLRFTVFGSSE
ncbi:MAG: heparinase II/III family protein, partial [Pedobacter sp.]